MPRTHKTTSPHRRLLVGRGEACRMLDVGDNTFAQLVSRGLLTPIRLGERTIRYRVADLEAFAADGEALS